MHWPFISNFIWNFGQTRHLTNCIKLPQHKTVLAAYIVLENLAIVSWYSPKVLPLSSHIFVKVLYPHLQMSLKYPLICFNAVTARGQTIIKVQACTVKKRSISSLLLFLREKSVGLVGWAITPQALGVLTNLSGEVFCENKQWESSWGAREWKGDSSMSNGT